MGKFIAAIVALLVLAAAIVVLAPNLIPAGTYKARLEAAASNAVGRDVTMGDDISFKIIPVTAFSVDNLVIANAAGFGDTPLARVERADIGVKLLPLFNGKVEISKFILTKPDLNLQKGKTGDVNWNLASQNAPQDEAASSSSVKELTLGDVRFVDGSATYTDAGEGKSYSLDAINATARLSSLNEPLEIDGTMNFQGAPSTAKIVVTNLADIIAKEPANLKLDLGVGGATIGADLQLAGGNTLAYNGPVNVNAPDLPALASLFGVELQNAPGFDKLSVSGDALGNQTSLAISNSKIDFDAIDAAGDVKLDWSGAKPNATGSLSVGKLDLRPYLPPPSADAKGFPAWSTDKLDFASLRNINADLDIKADEVFLNDIHTGASRMRLRIDNGRMTADIPELGFYKGGGSGKLVVDASRSVPAIAGDFKMSSVEANPFTLDLMKIDRLLGIGGFNLTFNATGSSQKAIMESLNGKGGFNLADGALKGVNIAKLATAVVNLTQGGGGSITPAALTSLVGEAQKPNEQTDFSSFLSNFTITNGQVNAPTIKLDGPFLTMTGVGDVNLPGQAIDLRLLPRVTASADNQSAKKVAIPLRVGGTFSNPTLSVDIESLLRGKAEDTLKGLLNKALPPKEGEAENPAASLLNGLIGGKKSSGSSTTSAPDGGAKTSGSAQKEETPEDAANALAGQALKSLFSKPKADEEKESEDAPK
ncbi:MAG: AsmA family protein [Parvularculaceae bacterium]